MTWFSERASEAIQRAGGRMTHQRQIVIELLEDSQGQLDVDTLYQLARTKDSSLSVATVYRTLNILEKVNLVQQRYRSRDHERRYYKRASVAPAYYFTCRACHKVILFESEFMDALQEQLTSQFGLEVFSACVCVDGLCQDCLSKSGEPFRLTTQTSPAETK